MIATSHAIVGAAAAVAVGTVTKNPAAALAVGIVSHLVCDSIPHLDYPPNSKFINDEIVWDKPLYIFAIIDSLVAIATIFIFWFVKDSFSFSSILGWGAFGGYLPDLVDNFPLWRNQVHILPILKQFHSLHHWVHENWNHKFTMPEYWKLGIATQVIIVLPCLYYLIK